MSYPPIDHLLEFYEEIKIIELMKQLNRDHRPGHYLIKSATIIHPDQLPSDKSVATDQVIRIKEGKIEEITSIDHLRELLALHSFDHIIDATGLYVFPGLTDAHVHLDLSNSQHLLNIVNGITSIRVMCGFPYVLKQRAMVNDLQLFAPKIYSAGTMLNEYKMGRWTKVVTTEDEAREAVRNHKNMGYDYIKVWNRLNLQLLRAAADEAQQLDIPIVGHIPHGVLVGDAVAAGMRTLEHFKGYLLDSNLTHSDEDYITATPEQGVWNCPTIIIQKNQSFLGDEARQLIESDQMRFVSRHIKKLWLDGLADELEEAERRGYHGSKRHYDLEVMIFKRLLQKDVQYLAGTDSGGGMKAVPGIVLLDELSLFEELGLAHDKILASATCNAGVALTQDDEIGIIKTGSCANLLLLQSNPVSNFNALRQIKSIFLMGRFIDSTTLDFIRNQIEQIYAVQQQLSEPELLKIVENFLEDEENDPYIKPHFYEILAEYFTEIGDKQQAITFYQKILNITDNVYDQEKLAGAQVDLQI